MIEVALFGAGRIGQIHAASLARQPGVRLRYVVDTDPSAALLLAGPYAAEVSDPASVMADPAVAAILIASSTDTHADLILAAAAANKAIFCEKPVDLDLQRARACAAAVKQAGVPCMIGFQRRYDPSFQALARRLAAGEIGQPEMLIVTSRDPAAPPIDYIRRSGGIFKDMLIHDFDLCRWLLADEVISIHASASVLTDPAIDSAGDADSVVVSLRTRQGRLAVINASRRAAYGYDQRFEVLGSKGMLQAGNHRPTEVIAYGPTQVASDLPEHFFLQRYRAAYESEIAHFIALLNGQAVDCSSIDDGVKALELADAASRSWQQGCAISL